MSEIIAQYAQKLIDRELIQSAEQIESHCCPQSQVVYHHEGLDALAVLKEKDGALHWTFLACLNEPTEAGLTEFFQGIKDQVEGPVHGELGRNCLYWRMWPDHLELLKTVFESVFSQDLALQSVGDIQYYEAGE